MGTTTLALVGAAGGAGTTRTAVELAAMGARDGRDVAVVDAAFTTQGLSEYVDGRIETDLTTLLTDDTAAPLAAATYPLSADGGTDADDGTVAGAPPSAERDVPTENSLPGTAELVPVRAPFERLARAKTAEAARELERRIEAAADAYDAVVLDVAPVAANEAVAAVTTVDRVAAVRPATPHGWDALQRLRGRVADVGGGVDATVAVACRGDDTPKSNDADVFLPRTDPAIATAPVAATADSAYAEAVAEAYGDLFDTAVGVAFEETSVLGRLR